MSFIWVSVSGAGTAYVDNPNPVDGDTVTLYAYPDSGEQINDIYGIDSHGQYVAFSPVTVQSFVYHALLGDITIYVEFSGTTPPTPTTPAWFYAILKKITERS